jgi:hypothetical protein
MKQVVCIKNFCSLSSTTLDLTLGKVYDVVKEHNLGPGGFSVMVYDVIDDTGRINTYNQQYFQYNLQPTAQPYPTDWLDAMKYTTRKMPNFVKNMCQHKWTHYVGIREEYDFCSICDLKK